MFDSYFFIPANRKEFVLKVSSIDSSFIIFDLEESVNYTDLEKCIDNLSLIKILYNYSVRVPINYDDIIYSGNIIIKLYQLGFRTFVLPKIEKSADFDAVKFFFKSKKLNNIKFSIIIENPIALLNAKSLIETNRNLLEFVMIGSHDYCNIIGCKNISENLIYLKQKMLTICKAFTVPIIDVVSTNIKDFNAFELECVDAFNAGFEGKALIHPSQLNVFNNAPYYSKDEVAEAEFAYNCINEIGLEKFAILKINGKIYEKPHLKRINNIIKYINKKKETI